MFLIIFLIFFQNPWEKTYGGEQNDAGFHFIESNDSNYIVVGNTYSFGNGGSDIYVLKIDENGDTLWTKTYGTQNNEFSFSIKKQNGKYLIVGNTETSDSSESDIYIIKIDENGNLIWSKTIQNPSLEYARDFEITQEGEILIVGFIKAQGGNFDAYILKTDSLGNLLWQKRYGGNMDEFLYSLCKGENEYLIVGNTYSFGNGGSDIYVLKIDENGDTLWAKTYGREDNDFGFYISKDVDENYFICGSSYWIYFGYEICYMKITRDGNLIWRRDLGSLDNDFAWFMQKTHDGGYVITGNFGTLVWLLKTDSLGYPLWSKNYGGTGFETGYCIKELRDSSYMIVGKTSSFGAGGYDVYLIKTEKDVKIKEKEKDFKNLKKKNIFDVTGRKIKKIKVKGIYIENSNKKLMIK